MSYNAIIIDGNNLFWRTCSRSIKKSLLVGGIELYPNTIREFLNDVIKLKRDFGYDNTEIYICFDNPTSAIQMRKLISNGLYKSHRDSNKVPKGFYSSLNFLYNLLKNYDDNWFLLKLSSSEADDLVLPLIKQKLYSYKKVLCVSVDMDWARNIRENIHWYNYTNVYDINSFESKWGFNPSLHDGRSVVMYKTLLGDSADSIPNPMPFEKGYSMKECQDKDDVILDIVKKYPTVSDMLENLNGERYSPEWKKRIKENSSQIIENEELVSYIPVNLKLDEYMIKSVENINILRGLFDISGLDYEPRMSENNPLDWFNKRGANMKLVDRRYYGQDAD
jgi:hypothetical protein